MKYGRLLVRIVFFKVYINFLRIKANIMSDVTDEYVLFIHL